MKKVALIIFFFTGIFSLNAQILPQAMLGGYYCYQDTDNDGYGNPNVSLFIKDIEVTPPNPQKSTLPLLASTTPGPMPNGYVLDKTDCNDNDTTINPGTIWYLDNDKDGYGTNNATTNKMQCLDPSTATLKYVLNSSDCNDANASITIYVWYFDFDQDGFGGTDAATIVQCTNPSTATTKYVTNNTDCNDSNPKINLNRLWYLDNDKDGFGVNNATTNKTQCADPSTSTIRYALNNTDCNDNNPLITTYTWYLDADKDGFGTNNIATNKTQCTNPSTTTIKYTTNADDADDANPNVTIVKINMTYDNAGNQLNRQFVVPTSVQSKLAATDRIDCLPNPVVDNATVSWQLIGVKTMKSIRLYNDKGVLLQTFLGLEKTNTQAINFKNYAAGQYQLLLQYSDSTQKAITITKQ